MAAGLQTLLEAAQFIEQQENLQLSPHSPRSPLAASLLNEQRFLVHSPGATAAAPYENGVLSPSALHNTNNNNISSNNNNNHIVHIRNSRHIAAAATAANQQVSSSAPTAGATFQHVNNGGGLNGLGLVGGGGGAGGINSQLITAAAAVAAAAKRHSSNDYEFSNGNAAGVVGVSTTTAVAASSTLATVATATANGRSNIAEGLLSEDAFSSSSASNTFPNPTTTAFLLISAAHEQRQQELKQQQQQQDKQAHTDSSNAKLAAAKITTADSSSGGGAVGIAAASKQMLLNGGIRIASPAAIVAGMSASKSINVPTAGAAASLTASPASVVFPLHSQSNPSASMPHSVPRYKSSIPLTPPPMSSRKTTDTHSRIRSFSLSSNKIAANHMLVEDGHMSYAPAAAGGSNSNSSSNHSPPRHGGGSHYWHMTSSATTNAAGAQVPHVSHPLGGSGRRRTISSNSNGAGTREVHNKLEKNRRAHLKECYETLKNELHLKDDDRKKTSNLSILSEALKLVQTLTKDVHDKDSEFEQLGKEKILLQKRRNTLKRELGPSGEKLCPDSEVSSIPNEREHLSDSASLSSGRGSLLYSSSSSLSSGGSNGSNTMSSPVGAGLQTAMPTAISPVIANINSNSTTANISNNPAVAAASAPISPILLQQHHLKSSASASVNNSPAGTAAINGVHTGGIISVANMPLSLTAKNISATSVTRGSPTPSTPSPSPSSSSGVSSSSSLISSSPPMNGVINGRNVTVNIPNGLKFQTTGGAMLGTIGNGAGAPAPATIITTTSAPNSNNAAQAQAADSAIVANKHNNNNLTTATISTITNKNGYRHAHHSQTHGRKTSLSIATDADANGSGGAALLVAASDKVFDYEDGEQPAKFIKVYSGLLVPEKSTTTMAATSALGSDNGCGQAKQLGMPPTLLTPVAPPGVGHLQLSQVVGGGSLVVSPSYITAARGQPAQLQKLPAHTAGNTEIGRLPGGAELNILSTSSSNNKTSTSDNNNNCNGDRINGTATAATTATFFNANGKLTLVSGGAAKSLLLKDSSAVSIAAPASSGTSGLTPLFVTATSNGSNGGIHYAGNFAQLIAATTAAAGTGAHTAAPLTLERLNGKLSLSLGGPALAAALPLISTQHCGTIKPLVVTVAAATAAHTNTTATSATAATTTASLKATSNETILAATPPAGRQQLNTNKNAPTFSATTSSSKSLSSETLASATLSGAMPTNTKTVPPIKSSTNASVLTTNSNISNNINSSNISNNDGISGIH